VARVAAGVPIDFRAQVPAGNAAEKPNTWIRQGAEIMYLTSRTRSDEVEHIRNVLNNLVFPKGELFSRQVNEAYYDVAERVLPDRGSLIPGLRSGKAI
jgi:hypothetical protein